METAVLSRSMEPGTYRNTSPRKLSLNLVRRCAQLDQTLQSITSRSRSIEHFLSGRWIGTIQSNRIKQVNSVQLITRKVDDPNKSVRVRAVVYFQFRECRQSIFGHVEHSKRPELDLAIGERYQLVVVQSEVTKTVESWREDERRYSVR